jgi:hypothetical protein
VGRHTSLNHNVVQGGVLLNWELGVNLKIAEDFILCDLSRRSRRTPLGERMLAAFLFAGLIVPAAFRNGFRSPHRQVVRLGDGEEMELRTWSKGPLMLRRVFWLLAVLRGRFRILGVLPRGANDWDALTPELHALLAGTPAGVFALSDLHDCHDAAQPDESLHAAYQAGAAENFGLRQLKRAIFAVALKSPLP